MRSPILVRIFVLAFSLIAVFHGTLYLFDEPTTGLHFDDIKQLLSAFNQLVEDGHSVVIVEHNLEILKSADWIIDLGPEGGARGGEIVCAGPPETIARHEASHTGRFLRQELQIHV